MSVWRQPRGDGTFSLRFGGGLNERDDFNVSPEECTEGKNFLLDPYGSTLSPRPPMDLLGTAPNAGEITGLLQLIERDDTVTQLAVAGDTWYNWDGASVFSDVTPPIYTSDGRPRGSYWSLDDILVVTNLDKTCPLYKWNASTVSRLKTGLTIGSALTLVSLTGTFGGVATATYTSHGYSDGDLITIAAATNTEYNGEYQIYNTAANTFQYTFSYDGNTSAGGTPTSDKGVELKAKYSVVHDHRVWLFNVTADASATPHMILVSAYEDAEDYDNLTRGTAQDPTSSPAANDAFYILSPDGRPINGAVEFFDTIIFSTEEGKLFRIDGNDATNYTVNEFYPGSSAEGEEALVNTGNDIIYFRRGKVVESLAATQKYGDVATDDLSVWIPDTIQTICTPRTVYDEENQRIYFFCDNAGGVLVLDKTFLLIGKTDGEGRRLSPWSFYSSTMANELATQCAILVRTPGSTTKKKTVIWGDDSGNIYDVNGTIGNGDGGSDNVNVVRKTKVISDVDTNNELMIGRVEYKRISDVTFEMTFNWADEYHQETVEVPLKASFGLGGANFWGGDIWWNQGVGDLPDLSTSIFWNEGRVVDDQISSLGFSAPGKGSAFILEVQVTGTEDFLVSRVVL